MTPKIAEIFETMEYGPAPENRERALEWLDARGRAFDHFIGGEWTSGTPGERFDVLEPATGQVLAQATQGSAEDVDRAVRVAREAQPGWWALDPHERARHLYALARTLQRNARLFAVLETLDNGKPIRESRDLDIPLVARHFYHHAGWAQLLPDTLPGQVPVGVVGQVIPWNFPLLMMAWKVAPALATGNTVVLKPAEFTPLTALLFAELAADAGLPAGVLNVVTGDGETGAAVVAHPDVDKIAFTGSTEVGRIIRRETAGSGKRLSLELGGKSPFVVYDDADLDSVVEGVVDAIWFNQGQVCCAGSRILVQEGVAADLERKLRDRMETLRMGDPLDKGVDMGAIVAPVQLERITRLVEEGREEGVRVWQPSWSAPREGWFYPPTLCTDVSPSATLAREEIFGPVVVMMTFRTPEESVEMANDTRYGLAASVWTESVNLALDVAPKIKAGTVWVNCTNLFDAASGFGGYRESGFGREGGEEGIREYVRPAWEAAMIADAESSQAESSDTEGSETSRAAADDAEADRAESPGAEADGAEPEVAERGGPKQGDARDIAAPASAGIDRTAKLYIGGKQVRPDAEYTLPVHAADGTLRGDVPRGNRKDVRNAVEAARKAAEGWAGRTAHNRAQILYYVAENLSTRAGEITDRLEDLTGGGRDRATAEVEETLRRLFAYAAWADKWEGRVHRTPFRNVTLAMPEPIGVTAAVCPDEPSLLGLVSLAAPLVATGNTVVVVPSERWPLPAVDLYQILETSDLPGGVLNIVTGLRSELSPVLASHDAVDAMWHHADREGGAEVERLSTGNMKRTWVGHGLPRDWMDREQAEGEEFLREATQVKNIWVPYGE